MQQLRNLAEYIRWKLRRDREMLESMSGVVFALFMSGLISRYLKDPDKELFNSLLGSLGLLLIVVLIILMTFIVDQYRKNGMKPWMRATLLYLAQALSLLMVYVSGFLVPDAPWEFLGMGTLLGATFIGLELVREDMGIQRPSLLRRRR